VTDRAEFSNPGKKGRAEIPVAAVGPQIPWDDASRFPEELTGFGVVKPRGVKRDLFSQSIYVYNIVGGMVRMPVDAAHTTAFRAYNCRMLLNKGTQIFYFFSYAGRNIRDLINTTPLISEDVCDILLVTSQAFIAVTNFSHGH
jgi:hypothetical protein